MCRPYFVAEPLLVPFEWEATAVDFQRKLIGPLELHSFLVHLMGFLSIVSVAFLEELGVRSVGVRVLLVALELVPFLRHKLPLLGGLLHGDSQLVVHAWRLVCF